MTKKFMNPHNFHPRFLTNHLKLVNLIPGELKITSAITKTTHNQAIYHLLLKF